MKIEGEKFLTPVEIVRELDKYVIGQDKAKRAVAIALRNRWRRLNVKGPLKDEITPNNIILIGPTGVGKTEIARRLANLAKAPFVKVEATRFTEVGYVGKNVESMIRDLMEISINMVKSEKLKNVEEKAKELAREKILEVLFPSPFSNSEDMKETREKLREMFEDGKFDDRDVEIDVEEKASPFFEVVGPLGTEELNLSIPEGFEALFPRRKKRKRVKVKEAIEIIKQQEASKLIDMDEVIKEAKERAETSGIIFIDEIDKIVGSESTLGPDVSRAGVQRDLLPIVEGTKVMTKYGMIKTDHILFIAAGAFHNASPSDLIPELQGRFPIRVELDSLGEEEFKRILVEPENSLVKQYKALFETEEVTLEFTEAAIAKIARYAAIVNDRTENIGARRLHTVMSHLLEDLLFELPKPGVSEVIINEDYVDKKLSEIIEDEDLSRYIL